MKLKKVLALLLAVMMIASMVACSGQSGTGSGTAAPSSNGNTNDESSKSIAGATITVFATGYSDTKANVFAEILKEFEAESGVKVEMVTPGNDGESQLKTMMASNSMPDVWMTHGWSLIRYSEYLLPVNDQPWFNTMAVDTMKPVMADEDGNFYALNMTIGSSGLSYNKDALDKAGVDPNSIRTWADFDKACAALVDVGITPIVCGGGDGWTLAGLFAAVAPSYWTDQGAKYDLASELQNGTFDFDKYAPEVFEYIASWVNNGYLNKDVMTLTNAGAQEMLGSGEAAFMFMGLENVTAAREYYPDANMGLLPVPASVEGGAPSFRAGEGDAWGVWKDTKNPGACWALLAFLARPEIVTRIAAFGAMPCIEGAEAADSYVLEAYQKAIADCNGNIQFDNDFDRKYLPSGMWNTMSESTALALDNPNDVSAAVKCFAENYASLYEEAHS